MGIATFTDNQPYKYAHITTATTTTLKTTPGTLHTVVVNTPGTTNAVTINDGSNVIATYTAAAGTQIYDVGFAALSIVTSAACDITVSYN